MEAYFDGVQHYQVLDCRERMRSLMRCVSTTETRRRSTEKVWKQKI